MTPRNRSRRDFERNLLPEMRRHALHDLNLKLNEAFAAALKGA